MKRHMIVFLLIGHYAVSPDFLMGEERYPDHPAMMKETLTPAWQGGGTPNFASRILETGPKGEGDGAKVEPSRQLRACTVSAWIDTQDHMLEVVASEIQMSDSGQSITISVFDPNEQRLIATDLHRSEEGEFALRTRELVSGVVGYASEFEYRAASTPRDLRPTPFDPRR